MRLWIVQYLCQYRPIWRDAAETFNWAEAVAACQTIRIHRGRPARIVTEAGQEVYSLP